MEKRELTSKERLERVFRILEVIQQRRLESSEEWVGAGLEWQLLERELRELEEDVRCDPPVLPEQAGQSQPPRGARLRRRPFGPRGQYGRGPVCFGGDAMPGS
jgi:hypothetical protein